MKMPFSDRPMKDLLAAGGFLIVCLMLIFAAIWAYRQFITTPPYVDPVKYPIRGIDVSSHNGFVDFKKVADNGIKFVFIKATEGVDFKDKNFRQNYNRAKAAGLKTGVYHFFRFDKDGVRQAINLLRAIGNRQPELGLVIDVEKTGNPYSVSKDLVIKRLSEMVDYLNLMGHRVMFYTNFEGFYDYIAESFPGHPLWICRFRENPINAEWTFWQYSHSGTVAGITGNVDMNAFCGNEKEWKLFLGGALWPYNDLPSNNED